MFGEELKKVQVVEKILNSVPRKFEATIASLLQSKDLPDISITEIVNTLQAAELRISARDETSVEEALLAKNKGNAFVEIFTKKNSREKDRKFSHAENCWFKPDAKCKICNQLGHADKVCKNKPIVREKTPQTTDKVEVAEETLFMASTISQYKIENDKWLLDSRCSNHMTAPKVEFINLDKDYMSRVNIGNGVYLHAMGKVTVKVKSLSRFRYISEVLLVPSITQIFVEHWIDGKELICLAFQRLGMHNV
ncbi:Gag-pol polyprotein-like protein [Theobroma cacao]|uniref:Gag-pol polyprotein-like protein n=1 Tax=Theobroma cacao TaxID=3641 RepID=A0A061ETK2_THECC|nr:Gag-pol polyprotein-like protein [Theobroma cacao]